MKPVSPVFTDTEPIEKVFARNQPAYTPLPAIIGDANNRRVVTSRWELTSEEREAIANGADILISSLTFNTELQPVIPIVAFRGSVVGSDLAKILDLE